MPTFKLTWTIDAEGTDALDAARRVATDYFQARIAQGHPDTACVFQLTDHEGQAVTIDLSAHRIHLECAHAALSAPSHGEQVQRLREALPYLRNAVAEASASGVAQLAVVSTKPDGSGKLVCKFECVEFMADLAAVVGAGPQTEDDDARAEARKFLQRNGIASTGQEVKP